MANTVEASPARATPQGNVGSTNGLGPDGVSEIQRARILLAMAEVSTERGVSNVTVADVVSRSGVSRRTFYEQFSSRDECFLATFDEALASASRYVVPAYQTPARWHERIRVSLIALLDFLDDEPFLGRILLVESLGAGPAALRRRREVLASVLEAVDQGRSATKHGESLPPVTVEGIVGGVLSVLHSRLLDPDTEALSELAAPFMSMIVLPYLGEAAAKGELSRAAPTRSQRRAPTPANPLRDLQMRLTYRTARVLSAVASAPGASNREVGRASGIVDQGQISKLLTRLAGLGLIENTGDGRARGAPNAWTLTEKGAEIECAIGEGAALRS